MLYPAAHAKTETFAIGPLVLWLSIYPLLLCLGHVSLRTNAYDLSVFDYALWSTLAGRVGDVPFLGHSLFDHHVMPTLLALLPLYALWPSPWVLILVQIAAVPVAWWMCRGVFHALTVTAAASHALLFAWLFSRRTHSAVTGLFYIESLEPALTFWMIRAWLRGRRRQYWIALVLALGCKEDMALYVGAFGLVLMVCHKAHRRLGCATAVVAAMWLVLSVWVIVPAVRRAHGLPPAYPLLAARYHDDGATAGDANVSAANVLGRIVTPRSLRQVFNLTSTVALLCFGGPEWLVVALPGLAANLAAARSIRGTLSRIPKDIDVWAAPNLLPHIEHRVGLRTIGSLIEPRPTTTILAYGTLGNLWPLDRDRLDRITRACREDPHVSAQPTAGPLVMFRLSEAAFDDTRGCVAAVRDAAATDQDDAGGIATGAVVP